jgi:hypothetical protein
MSPLLSALIQISPTWWATCSATQEGKLQSSDARIQELLHPLNVFAQAMVEESTISVQQGNYPLLEWPAA